MGRFLLMGTIIGGVLLFAWGAVSHVAIPWWELVLHEFKDSKEVVDAIQDNIPENGVYYARNGVLAAVRIDPNYTGGEPPMGAKLVRQFITELVTVFLLALLLLKTPIRSPGAAAGFLGLAALAAGAAELIPHWNWYGFSAGFIGLEFIDLIIGWMIVGFVLGAIRRKTAPAAG